MLPDERAEVYTRLISARQKLGEIVAETQAIRACLQTIYGGR